MAIKFVSSLLRFCGRVYTDSISSLNRMLRPRTLSKFSTVTRVILAESRGRTRERKESGREKEIEKDEKKKMGSAWGPMEYGHYSPFFSLSTAIAELYLSSLGVLFLRMGVFAIGFFELLRILQRSIILIMREKKNEKMNRILYRWIFRSLRN